jgi:hypothetical protein
MEIGDPTTVSRFGSTGNILGLTAGPGPSDVICTHQPAGVQVLDLSSGTCTHSWSLRNRVPKLPAVVCSGFLLLSSFTISHHDNISSQVINTENEKRIVLACADGSISYWGLEETDISKATTISKVRNLVPQYADTINSII